MRTKIRVDLDESSDVEMESARLRSRLNPEIDPSITATVIGEFQAASRTLIEQARKIAEVGSQLSAERHIRNGDVEIHVRVNGGKRPGLTDRLKALIGLR